MKKWFSFGIGMIVLGIITTLIFPCTVMAAKEIKIGVIYPLTGGAAASHIACTGGRSTPCWARHEQAASASTAQMVVRARPVMPPRSRCGAILIA